MTEEKTQRRLKKEDFEELRGIYLRSRKNNVAETCECNWCENLKDDESVKKTSELPLKQKSLSAKISEKKLFGFVQCELESPDRLNHIFSIFPPIFKNFNVCQADIGDFKRNYETDSDFFKQS